MPRRESQLQTESDEDASGHSLEPHTRSTQACGSATAANRDCEIHQRTRGIEEQSEPDDLKCAISARRIHELRHDFYKL